MSKSKIAVLLIYLFCVDLFADQWAPASTRDYASENGKYVVQVIPARDRDKPSATVFSVTNGKRKKMWQTNLINSTAPVEAALSDDGNSLVTFDNWGGVGYGTNVVVIYSKKGMLKSFSLENFAPEPKEKKTKYKSREVKVGVFEISGSGVLPGYHSLFSHSISSRNWRQDSLSFFYQETSGLMFCLWLDWDQRWVAWQMNDGSIVKVSGEQTRRWNAEGRKRSLLEAKKPDPSSNSLNFLGRLKNPEDRQYIEKQLKDPVFSPSTRQSSSSTTQKFEFQFRSSSWKRSQADQILSRWDGLLPEISLNSHDGESIKLLGTVEASVMFPAAPKKGEGTIRAYLIPANTPLVQWSKTTPEHYLVGDLRSLYPYDFTNGKVQSAQLDQQIRLSFLTVTPGDYRLKIIWFRNEPASESEKIFKLPSKGDYESVDSPIITVRAGQVVKDIQVKSMSLVK